MKVIEPGWLVKKADGTRLITRWHLGGPGPALRWEDLAEQYPDRVVTEEQYREIYPK